MGEERCTILSQILFLSLIGAFGTNVKQFMCQIGDLRLC